jgi:hypothetical protein
MEYIFSDKYRHLFSEHIEQALDYIKNLKEEDFKAKVCFIISFFSKRKICFFSQLIQYLNYYRLYVKSVQLYGLIVLNKSNNYILIYY